MSINEVSFKRILKRQSVARWGDEYDPAIHATKHEAPNISRPHMFKWRNRTVHCLSTPEYQMAILALWLPGLFEFHEQRMLPLDRRPHPLSEYPDYSEMSWPSTRGTVAIAADFGFRHPSIYVRMSDAKVPVPYPYVGDLLVYLKWDRQPYMVNWNIKASEDGFVSSPDNSVPKNPGYQKEKMWIRREIERELYRDWGIRTEEVAITSLPRWPIQNLIKCHGYLPQVPHDKGDLFFEIFKCYTRAIEEGECIKHFVGRVCRNYKLTDVQGLSILYFFIWVKWIQVDLYSPIHHNEPLRPERRIFLDEIGHLWKP